MHSQRAKSSRQHNNERRPANLASGAAEIKVKTAVTLVSQETTLSVEAEGNSATGPQTDRRYR